MLDSFSLLIGLVIEGHLQGNFFFYLVDLGAVVAFFMMFARTDFRRTLGLAMLTFIFGMAGAGEVLLGAMETMQEVDSSQRQEVLANSIRSGTALAVHSVFVIFVIYLFYVFGKLFQKKPTSNPSDLK